MGQAIGNSIPYAIGVAVSPLSIIAVVLMLLSRRAGANSTVFGLAWLVGIGGAMTAVLAVAAAIGTTSNGAPSQGASIVKLALGALLLALGVRSWRRRPAPGTAAALPKWMQAVEQITPFKSAGLAVLLSAFNPENLLLIVAGGIAISQAPTSLSGHVIAAVVFVAIAAVTVVVPVVLYRVLGTKAERPLRALNEWLRANYTTVVSIMLLVIGVLLVGKGIEGF